MERLTIEYCGEYVPKDMCSIDRLGGADDCDLCCEYCKATEEGNEDCRECAISKCFNKLGKYETLEEQGKLLKLPCAVGDVVYYLDRFCSGTSLDCPRRPCEPCEYYKLEIYEGKFKLYDVNDFGEAVFLTREDAEAALKELERGKGE